MSGQFSERAKAVVGISKIGTPVAKPSNRRQIRVGSMSND